ncbi:SDR family NAD(P)-dependent oxidoreductase [Parapedobacter indicus]|uniref:Short-chain dehydrogenase n=1 Tax=Parapedobacter indicus TaxID=1477437 RepID=A0A1I3VBG9_9SPHI|nr:SDR family NAD(P)-dependent oxidoreductase [Parapedobacter indicus]PPK98938.1 short-subunit dehydrogenase [Parapedobacter indicus]SFJ92353.1 Short-chain dehydrogenase [Parapedobacter indicus]
MSKTILITGSGSGYGKLIAKALSEEGHGVIATMEITDDKSREAADELRSTPNIEVINIDLNSEKSIAENVGKIIHKYGAIDILVNDAEVASMGLLEANSITQIKSIFDIGLFNVIRMIQAVLPDMRKNKSGTILNICCGPALFSLPFLIPQTLSKIGIIALSEGLQAELRHEGIDCFSVLVDGCLSESFNDNLVGADLPEVTETYEIASKKVLNKLKHSIYKLEPTEENRQRIVYDIINTFNMNNQTRMGQVIIDKNDDPIVRELLERRIELKNKWLEQIGMEI